MFGKKVIRKKVKSTASLRSYSFGRIAAGLFLLFAVLACQSCARQHAPAAISQPIAFTDQKPANVQREILEFAASDGKTLGYVHYRPLQQQSGIALVYLHGIESHAGWFEGPAFMLAERGHEIFCLDRRGSGINRENRGFTSGDVNDWKTLIDDIHVFLQQIRPAHKQCAVVGLSWGGKLALAYALSHPEDVDSLVLITPGLVSRVDLNWGQKLGVALSLLAHPKARFALPIKTEMFSDDPAWLDLIRRDPLRLHDATARFLMASRRMDRFIAQRIGENRIPILLFLAGQDQIVNNPATASLLKRGSQSQLQIHCYEDQAHSIQFETPAQLVRDMDEWLKAKADGTAHFTHEGAVP